MLSPPAAGVPHTAHTSPRTVCEHIPKTAHHSRQATVPFPHILYPPHQKRDHHISPATTLSLRCVPPKAYAAIPTLAPPHATICTASGVVGPPLPHPPLAIQHIFPVSSRRPDGCLTARRPDNPTAHAPRTIRRTAPPHRHRRLPIAIHRSIHIPLSTHPPSLKSTPSPPCQHLTDANQY